MSRYSCTSNWPVFRIGDIAEVSTGGTPSTSHKEYYGGSINWLKSGDVKGQYITHVPQQITELGLVNSNARVHPRGTVVLAMSGQGKTRGTAAILDVESACSQSVAAILPNPQIIPEFLYLIFRSKYEEIRRITGDNERTGLNLKLIRNMQIPVPNLTDQKRIAASLGKEMEILARAQRAGKEQLAAAKALATAYLREVFDSAETRLWKEVRLGEVCDFWGGMQPPAHTFKRTKEPGHIQLVQIQDFRRRDTAVFIREEDAKRRFDETDVMIGRYGPPVFQILRGLLGAYNVALMKATPKDALIKDFLFYLLKEEKIQRAVIAQSERSAGQSGVQKEFLENYLVRVPPISEQVRLAAYLNSKIRKCGEVERNVREQVEILNNIPAALFRRAFLTDPFAA